MMATTNMNRDWIEEIASRLCESADCARQVHGVDEETAMEIALNSSCAGPKSIARARTLLAERVIAEGKA